MTVDTLPRTKHYVLVDGPTKNRIKEATRRSHDPATLQPPLKFTTGDDIALLSLYITDMRPSSGSGTPLAIQGYLASGESFTGHYDASTRSGYIDVTTPLNEGE